MKIKKRKEVDNLENIKEFDVTDTLLWKNVKKGLTKKWLEHEADINDLDYLIHVYNEKYEGGIFDNEEDAINHAFSNAYEAFYCAIESEGNYSDSDNWYVVEKNDYLLWGYDDSAALEKIIDEMSKDIGPLSRDIDDDIIDKDNEYREIVRDITLIQRYYLKTLERINNDLFKYIDENTSQGYEVADLKGSPIFCEEDKQSIKTVTKSRKLSELITKRNNKVKELLNTDSEFLKGALYNTIIEAHAKKLSDVSNQLVTSYDISIEFREKHAQEFDEVKLDHATIAEFII